MYLRGLFIWAVFVIVFSTFVYSGIALSGEIPDPGQNRHDNNSTRIFTLAQSVAQGLEANPRVKAEAFRELAAEAERKGVRGNMLPAALVNAGRTYVNNVSGSGAVDIDYIDQQTDTAYLRVSQPIFAGMTLFNTYQKAKIREELVKAEKELTEMQLVLEIQTQFLELLKTREDVNSLKETFNSFEMSLESIRAFEKVRMAPYVDVLQAEVEFADTRQRLSQAENKVRTQKITLNTLLGLPPHENTDFIGELGGVGIIPWSREECISLALENRADLHAEKMALDMAQKDVSIAKGRFSPKVNLEWSYVTRDLDYDQDGRDFLGRSVDRDYRTDYWTFGVNVQWAFFEGGKNYYEQNRAGHEVSRIRERILETTSRIEAQVQTFFMDLIEAGERIKVIRGALNEARENQERSRVRFESRVGTITELLDAQTRLSRTEANLNQALADYHLALARLFYSMGERKDDLQL
jgi:outer membrane protein